MIDCGEIIAWVMLVVIFGAFACIPAGCIIGIIGENVNCNTNSKKNKTDEKI